jgi:8-oxo-dGTP pyrophosphatase MutT (NUDIX family)
MDETRGVMNDFAAYLTRAERDQSHPNVRPRDAATLILIDRSGGTPKVLLGRRHDGHKFLPGKLVFPGGRLEPADRRVAGMTVIDPLLETQLTRGVHRPSRVLARALALAAVRETFEETGLLLGTNSNGSMYLPDGPWSTIAAAGYRPDLSQLYYIARAITPPGRPKRFDTRFFCADAGAIAYRVEGIVGPDAELVELVWLPIAEAKQLEMQAITQVILAELEARIAAGLDHATPVPFYRMRHKRFVRTLLS